MHDPVYGMLVVWQVISLPLTPSRPVKKVKILEVKGCTKKEAVKFAIELLKANHWLKYTQTDMEWIPDRENIGDEVFELTRKGVNSQEQ